MCRQNQLLGWILISFGVGLMIGLRLEAEFGASLIALGSIAAGFYALKRK